MSNAVCVAAPCPDDSLNNSRPAWMARRSPRLVGSASVHRRMVATSRGSYMPDLMRLMQKSIDRECR